MSLKDPRRRAVSERLRSFFAELQKQLSEGVEELWHKVQDPLRRKPAEPEKLKDDVR